jgi:hypothetical protein
MREQKRNGIGAPLEQGPAEVLGGEPQAAACESGFALLVRQEGMEVHSCPVLADEDLVETIRRMGYKGKAVVSERRSEDACGAAREASTERGCYLDLAQRGLEDSQDGQAPLDEDLVEKIRRLGC